MGHGCLPYNPGSRVINRAVRVVIPAGFSRKLLLKLLKTSDSEIVS
jgi:hypothetical protein